MSEYKDWTRADFISHIEDQDREHFDLIAKVVELINVIGWDDSEGYCFSDGDRWHKFDPVQESIEDE